MEDKVKGGTSSFTRGRGFLLPSGFICYFRIPYKHIPTFQLSGKGSSYARNSPSRGDSHRTNPQARKTSRPENPCLSRWLTNTTGKIQDNRKSPHKFPTGHGLFPIRAQGPHGEGPWWVQLGLTAQLPWITAMVMWQGHPSANAPWPHF